VIAYHGQSEQRWLKARLGEDRVDPDNSTCRYSCELSQCKADPAFAIRDKIYMLT
jgi:hypothetical protein